MQSGNSARNSFDANETENEMTDFKRSKKRRREKHRDRYSPDIQLPAMQMGKHHSRKRKHKSPDRDASSEQEPPRQGIKLFVSTTRASKFYVRRVNVARSGNQAKAPEFQTSLIPSGLVPDEYSPIKLYI